MNDICQCGKKNLLAKQVLERAKCVNSRDDGTLEEAESKSITWNEQRQEHEERIRGPSCSIGDIEANQGTKAVEMIT